MMRESIRWCKRIPPSKAGFTIQQYTFDEPTLLDRGSVSIERGLIVEQTLFDRKNDWSVIGDFQFLVFVFRLANILDHIDNVLRRLRSDGGNYK